jgi:6-phosphofructokinase 2
VKPSRGEFERFAGREARHGRARSEAERLVSSGKAANVAITLGGEGAIFVNAGGRRSFRPFRWKACSTVGAGDSFLAGMVYGFATGRSADQALRIGLAGGAAAVLSCGSELAALEDLKRLVGEALAGEQVDDVGVGSDGFKAKFGGSRRDRARSTAARSAFRARKLAAERPHS